MKQYLLLVDDNTKALFLSLMPSLQLLEIQGLSLNNENRLQMLATPINTPVTPAVLPPLVQPTPVPPEETPPNV